MSSKSKPSTGLVFEPYGRRDRKRGIAKPMYCESSDSRRLRQAAYSGGEKILVRSRGLASSCHESICSTDGSAPAMNGQCAAEPILASSPSISTSGALWSKK